MTAAPQGNAAASRQLAQELTVVVNRERKKAITIMQLPGDLQFDKSLHVNLARENNLKEHKTAYNMDSQPTTGAGSEFGREAKDEARRRKYGYIRKNYNPDAQPWIMNIGPEKNAKKFKGSRNGGILENASYFIFTKRPDGVFEAIPVEEWHSFKPTISYKNLNAEEAEEEYARRDKNMNMFSIMVRKRLKKEDNESTADDKEKVRKEIRSGGLMLTEMEDWEDMSDDGNDAAADDDDEISDKKKKGGKNKAKKKKEDKDSDDEAVEDSDDGDKEAKQVDYMSDTSESDSDYDMREDKSKYEEKGVEDEDGLRELAVESDNESEKKEEDEKKEKESNASSSSSESESDDPDREDNEFTKAFLMAGSKKDRVKSPVPRSATPTDDKKRKLNSSPGESSPSSKKVKQEPGINNSTSDDRKKKVAAEDILVKKVKQEPGISSLAASKPLTQNSSHTSEPRPVTPGSAPLSSRDGLTEDTVKRYLMRKPMSSTDLCRLFKSKKLGLSKDEIVVKITNILKRLKTTQQKINGVLHFSIAE